MQAEATIVLYRSTLKRGLMKNGESQALYQAITVKKDLGVATCPILVEDIPI